MGIRDSSKAVIVTTLILLASGTVLIWLTEDITWLGAFFTSVSARTAGFSTFPLGEFTSCLLYTSLDRPTLGHYYLDGIDVADMTPDQLSDIRNRKIGFVFQLSLIHI